jgi:hypothetical protein
VFVAGAPEVNHLERQEKTEVGACNLNVYFMV